MYYKIYYIDIFQKTSWERMNKNMRNITVAQ